MVGGALAVAVVGRLLASSLPTFLVVTFTSVLYGIALFVVLLESFGAVAAL